jgi:hypothetical protein
MMIEKELERQRLKELGCVEFKSIAANVGQRFIVFREWSENRSNIVIEVSGYWQAQNAHGYAITMYGDDLVMLTDEPLSRSIYVDNGLDFEKHSEILKADILE